MLGSTLDEIEHCVLLKTLANHDNNKPKTAETMGISATTVYNGVVLRRQRRR